MIEMLRILSNVNLEPMRCELSGEDVSFAGFNQLDRELLDSSSPLYSPDVREVWIFLDAEELLKDRLYSCPEPGSADAVLAELNSLLGRIAEYAQHRDDALVTVNTLALPPRTIFNHFDANGGKSVQALEDAMNSAVTSVSQKVPNLLVLDWRMIVKDSGYANLADDRFWYLARARWNKRALRSLATEYRRIRTAYTRAPKKVLLLDLDNTMWGGVLGEAGVNGIELSEDGVGKAYREMQQVLKGLSAIGVLLAIVSKNNEADVVEAFERHPLFALRLDDFAARRVNWSPKPQNIIEIAEELSLSFDAMVFLDDNPVERDLVRASLPEVAVPDFPTDPTMLKTWLLTEIVPEYFQRLRLTREDQQKAGQYRANAARREFARRATVEEYICGLGIQLCVHVQPWDFRQRVTQLIQKTNQFNLSGKRYTEKEVHHFLGAPDSDVFALEYGDRFGKEGIVAAAIVKYQDSEAVIDTFVMSCRVIGRNVEFHFLKAIVSHLVDCSIKTVRAEYVPTPKNAVSSSLYLRAGLECYTENCFRRETKELYRSLSDLIGNWETQAGCRLTS
jgi:FkbH-like protein